MVQVRYRISPANNWSYIDANDYKFVRASDCYSFTRVEITFDTVYQIYNDKLVRYYEGRRPLPYTWYLEYLPNLGTILDYSFETRFEGTVTADVSLTYVMPGIRLITTTYPYGVSGAFTHGSDQGQGIYVPKSDWDSRSFALSFTPVGTPIRSRCNNCRLVAYKNGISVFNMGFQDCPIVEIGDFNECPPNTCEVDCGTHVCCYGSDGVSVFNFSK